ncbi:unnamed protein product [Rhizophagus irregularis]|nr:unnamed protein product [Rhizophagus irregularis]
MDRTKLIGNRVVFRTLTTVDALEVVLQVLHLSDFHASYIYYIYCFFVAYFFCTDIPIVARYSSVSSSTFLLSRSLLSLFRFFVSLIIASRNLIISRFCFIKNFILYSLTTCSKFSKEFTQFKIKV